MSNNATRTAEYAVDPIFVSRWSQRAMSGEAIPDAVLFSAFEAARWAPSAANAQPWRFVYSKRESATWTTFVSLLNERNRVWAAQASALVVLLSRTVRDGDKGPQRSRSHSFDAGAAWSNFAHQAHALGWTTRAIGGFDREGARRALAVPDDYEIEIVIAIGRATDSAVLPAELQAKEFPSGRLPVKSFVADGEFAFA
jgi:nitroreductase